MLTKISKKWKLFVEENKKLYFIEREDKISGGLADKKKESDFKYGNTHTFTKIGTNTEGIFFQKSQQLIHHVFLCKICDPIPQNKHFF
jgi:hypothetical protein